MRWSALPEGAQRRGVLAPGDIGRRRQAMEFSTTQDFPAAVARRGRLRPPEYPQRKYLALGSSTVRLHRFDAECALDRGRPRARPAAGRRLLAHPAELPPGAPGAGPRRPPAASFVLATNGLGIDRRRARHRARGPAGACTRRGFDRRARAGAQSHDPAMACSGGPALAGAMRSNGSSPTPCRPRWKTITASRWPGCAPSARAACAARPEGRGGAPLCPPKAPPGQAAAASLPMR